MYVSYRVITDVCTGGNERDTRGNLMDVSSVVMIGTGLSLDAFAVSIVSGTIYKQLAIRHILRMAAFFGAFQAVMPILGWSFGLTFRRAIQSYDHWVAFLLLAAIGSKMIYEAARMKRAPEQYNPVDLFVLLTLSVATSIDALAVGIALSLLACPIWMAVLIIGLITFVLSCTGVFIGKRLGHFFESKIEVLGGLVLIGIGIKIVVEHLSSQGI